MEAQSVNKHQCLFCSSVLSRRFLNLGLDHA